MSNLTDAEVDFLLEQFDQTDPSLQRKIVAELMVRVAVPCRQCEGLLAIAEEVERRAVLVPCKDGGKDAKPGSMIAGKWRVESSVDGWIVRLRAALAAVKKEG